MSNPPDVDEIRSHLEATHGRVDELRRGHVLAYREFLEEISQIPPDDATAAQFALVRRLATFFGNRAIGLIEQIREAEASRLKLTLNLMERDAATADFSAIDTTPTG